MRIHRFLQGIGIAGLLLASAGCYHRHGHHRHGPHSQGVEPIAGACALATCFGLTALGAPPDVAVTSAIIAGAVVLDHHDGHWHGYRCGCPSRWYDGHRVYWYGGRWEFHAHGQWYVVPDHGGHRGPGW